MTLLLLIQLLILVRVFAYIYIYIYIFVCDNPVPAVVKMCDKQHIISYHLFSFHGSVQDYKIHMDMEIVKFA